MMMLWIRFCTHFAPLSYRYFYDPLIDIDISQRLPIDIDIDIFQNCLIDIDIDIDIFQNCLIDIDIDINIFKNDHIDIDIFQKCRYIDNRYSISIYRTGLTSAASQAVPSVLFWVLRARLVYSFHIQIVRISPRRLLQEGSSEKKRM